MDNLIFSLNATVPIFLTMVLGMFFRKIGLIDKPMTGKLNRFVFRAALPAALFQDLAAADFVEVWNTKFVVFCFTVTVLSIMLAILISCRLHDRSIQGEFVQAAYRSSSAVMGMAFIHNIYGNSGMAPLMIIASVPVYNIMAVVVLSFFNPQRGKMDKTLIRKTLKGIVTNPIILGILCGLIWSLLRIPMPAILKNTVGNLAAVSTPLGIISMGASFELKKAGAAVKPLLLAVFMRLIGFCLLFLPVAITLGFRQSHLIAILVMLGSSTTISSYIMARNMGHEGDFTSGCIMLTTLLCAFSLTFWLFILKSFGLV